MKPDFNYTSVPHNYIHCFNNNCTHATECLRHQVALHVPDTVGIIHTVSPVYKIPDTTECRYFKKDELKLFASGMDHLFDKIPYNDAVIIQKQIQGCFEKSTYYRCKRKERLITPKEQELIRQVFLDHGIKEEPQYDEYIKQYEW